MKVEGLTPILNVSNIEESFAWFEKLGWEKAWDWGEPPTFGEDLTLLAGEVAAGRVYPQVGLEATWRDPLAALEALRQRQLEGKAVLVVD